MTTPLRVVTISSRPFAPLLVLPTATVIQGNSGAETYLLLPVVARFENDYLRQLTTGVTDAHELIPPSPSNVAHRDRLPGAP